MNHFLPMLLIAATKKKDCNRHVIIKIGPLKTGKSLWIKKLSCLVKIAENAMEDSSENPLMMVQPKVKHHFLNQILINEKYIYKCIHTYTQTQNYFCILL